MSERHERADGMLLTYQTDHNPPHPPLIFGLAEMTIEPPSWFAPFRRADPVAWRWHTAFAFDTAGVPAHTRITAWAVDAIAGKALELSGVFRVAERGDVAPADQ